MRSIASWFITIMTRNFKQNALYLQKTGLACVQDNEQEPLMSLHSFTDYANIMLNKLYKVKSRMQPACVKHLKLCAFSQIIQGIYYVMCIVF